MTKIGILHPGAMGISVAASAKNSGAEVYWVSAERSDETRQRAEEHGLQEVGTVDELTQQCEVIVSVCPPHAAEEVARQVMQASFSGLYVDGNAISPERSRRIGRIVSEAGGRFVDGGIVGGPAWKAGTTWLYLSGDGADTAAACFAAGPLETEILSGGIGQASALKMCFAAYTKGTTALLAAVLATAEAEGVREPLNGQWERYWDGFAAETEMRVRRVTAKAWRFAGEMEEIAATLEAADVPGGFHTAAAELYQRLAHFKGAAETPSIEAVLAALRE
ncbi:MAG: NAD(P)-dependent oxidoreductase [Anaerolineales bacterium]|nr:NAD(P)-dependent oxidoreductase [Anaerolineales bacterium]